MTSAAMASIPRATYRLQLHKDFGFDAAAEAARYIAAFGASHLYLSPIFMARPGSMHGYDVLDHGRINPELGGEEGFARLAARCRELGLGVVLDFVPNHMGVGGSDNPLWKDVLEWGQASPYADWFDIDWSPEEPTLQGRVLLPFLGRPYGDALADGEFGIAADAETGELAFFYFDNRFPLAPHTYASVLAHAEDPQLADSAGGFAGLANVMPAGDVRGSAAELKQALAKLLSKPGAASALDAACDRIARPGGGLRAAELHQLLEAQHYRLAFWRVATDEINYRRFFDINGLSGLRVERKDAFDYAHRRLLSLITRGDVQGVRLDHVDGLHDPGEYCRALQRAVGEAIGALPDEQKPIYLVVEKILAPHESLATDWPVHGATGYEFMALLNGLLVDPAGEAPLTRLYRRFTGRVQPFETVLEEAKRQIVRHNLSSELHMIARRLHRLAKASWRTQDFTLEGIRRALIDVFAAFPVYRTYVAADGPSEQDRRYLQWAIARGKASPGLIDNSVYDFIASILSNALAPQAGDEFTSADVIAALRRFEQTTPPVMAKSMEDTAFYRYVRLVSVNEVGGDPSRFSLSPAAFHIACRRRLEAHPGSLNATATHDHKRGEDVRGRLHVLAERPLDWTKAVTRWARMNRGLRAKTPEGEPQSPSRNDEYLFYQTLAGAWPLQLAPDDAEGVEAYAGRLADYMRKAAREAKERTSWAAPQEDYEQALESFVRGAMQSERRSAFLRTVHEFVQTIAPAGAVNGLAQTVLKLTAPGAPDFYQGAELWDFSLVDPDNRRPVDYGVRTAALQTDDLTELAGAWRDGRIKLAVARRLLALRAAAPDLFLSGDYNGLEAKGSGADRVVAFERRVGDMRLVVIAPRLAAAFAGGEPSLSLDAAGWAETRLDADLAGGRWLVGGPADGAVTSDLSAIFGGFPVAVWTNVQC
jgi:(1->4)-alpha-D-glucan 1-alpha-D-glucosylmutase